MNNENQKLPFGKEHAPHYDENWVKLSPINQALQFISNLVLLNLPEDANILCVGAGTGAELIALAKYHPNWKFMALDSSGSMLDVCKEKVEKEGLSSRCEFHEGFIETLQPSEKYDAATSFLVSHFLVDEGERTNFFKHISKCLVPGGYLINADLAYLDQPEASEELLKSWLNMQVFAGVSEDAAKASISQWGKAVAVLKPKNIESILIAAGFKNPVNFYQALFIHAWYARSPVS